MLTISALIFCITLPLYSYRINAIWINRICSIILLYSSLLSFNCFYYNYIENGIICFNGIFKITPITLLIEIFLGIIGFILLNSWAPYNKANKRLIKNNTTKIPTIREYYILILFSLIGSFLLITSTDIITMYLSVELQSFGLYIITTIYRRSLSATNAGLKYYLLGGLSSCILIFGCSIIYSFTGLTQFDQIFNYMSTINDFNIYIAIIFGFILITIAFMFKVAAAPFHNWAPDVYDGTPTIISSWLITMPKISLFIFLFNILISIPINDNITNIFSDIDIIFIWKNMLLFCSIASLLIGTILGLYQSSLKRLLAYSTISHVGFILLSMIIASQDSIEAFIFYIIVYSLTNAAIFLIIIAFSYQIQYKDLNDFTIDRFNGHFKNNIILSICFAICLFSLAGIPPLAGFFAKFMVLYSSIHSGYYFISFICILVSVISASYYLKIISALYFKDNNERINNKSGITTIHSNIISILIIFITFIILDIDLLVQICELLSIAIFNN